MKVYWYTILYSVLLLIINCYSEPRIYSKKSPQFRQALIMHSALISFTEIVPVSRNFPLLFR
jgi:hypothetical protein